MRAFPFNGARLQTHPSAVSSVPSAMPGGISVSANGTVAGSGIVWAITTDQLADAANVPGTFRAFDAADVSRELWNSNLNPTRDAMGTFTKFTSPVVVNGKVYVVTQSNQLQVYGLLF